MDDTNDELVSYADAADLFGVSVRTLQRYVADGRVRAVKERGKTFVNGDDVNGLVRGRVHVPGMSVVVSSIGTAIIAADDRRAALLWSVLPGDMRHDLKRWGDEAAQRTGNQVAKKTLDRARALADAAAEIAAETETDALETDALERLLLGERLEVSTYETAHELDALFLELDTEHGLAARGLSTRPALRVVTDTDRDLARMHEEWLADQLELLEDMDRDGSVYGPLD